MSQSNHTISLFLLSLNLTYLKPDNYGLKFVYEKEEVWIRQIMPCLDMKNGKVVYGSTLLIYAKLVILLKMQPSIKRKELMNSPC